MLIYFTSIGARDGGGGGGGTVPPSPKFGYNLGNYSGDLYAYVYIYST